MPHVLSKDGTSIFFNVYGHDRNAHGSPTPRALLIMGFAASHITWAPQLAGLLSEGCLVCLDNRGVGASDAPQHPSAYSTTLMAEDCMAVLEALGWDSVHVVGHSMGAMVAAKLAAAWPHATASLTLISGTGGGWQAIPLSFRSLWLGLQLWMASSVAKRAALDVKFHYSPRTLKQKDARADVSRHELLLEEYLAAASQGDGSQPAHGMTGQLQAVWRHSLSKKECRAIRGAGMPCLVIHGRDDIVAAPRHGAKLARRLRAPFLLLDGAHFVFREQATVVNGVLQNLLQGASFVQAAAASAPGSQTHVPTAALVAELEAWRVQQGRGPKERHAGVSSVASSADSLLHPRHVSSAQACVALL
ncbi:Epoxide hydrolase 4 [Auxenochlorella protothecoides]|uniref:Epoxide hydrolase 4 n=1 Tax=Auxenochlorella protothecoides TaxID=3075 RepID=A0A087SNZ3_AUXPR|nr:Epoxide hydrolase 4 [Auxenochlorella protothecoides]KFM27447.1 Epoxide hydrolase 4 [Auxenochlorella protothecoides]